MSGRKAHVPQWSEAEKHKIKRFIDCSERFVQKLRASGSAVCAGYEQRLTKNVTKIRDAFLEGNLQEAERFYNEIQLDICLVCYSLKAESIALQKYRSPKQVNRDRKKLDKSENGESEIHSLEGENGEK